MRAVSITDLVIGPGVSNVSDSGIIPSVGKQDLLTFNPVKPQNAAGKRMDPPVSVPVAQTLRPAVTATPEPEEEPPGTRG